MATKRDHAAMERRRLKAVALFEKGLGASAVARRLGVRRQSAHAWKRRWQQEGRAGLQSKGPAGPKSRLNPAQEEALTQAILDGPTAAGYATAVWTLPRISPSNSACLLACLKRIHRMFASDCLKQTTTSFAGRGLSDASAAEGIDHIHMSRVEVTVTPTSQSRCDIRPPVQATLPQDGRQRVFE